MKLPRLNPRWRWWAFWRPRVEFVEYEYANDYRFCSQTFTKEKTND